MKRCGSWYCCGHPTILFGRSYEVRSFFAVASAFCCAAHAVVVPAGYDLSEGNSNNSLWFGARRAPSPEPGAEEKGSGADGIMSSDPFCSSRAAARELANLYVQQGDPKGWFDMLYRRAGGDAAV